MNAVVRTGNRRNEILTQASRLFAEHGYEGAAIRLIASSSGVTEAAIYRHFDSKAHLYEEVIRAKANQHDIAGYLAAHRGRGTMQDVLRRVADHILGLAAADPELVRLTTYSGLDDDQSRLTLFQLIRLPYIEHVRDEIQLRMDAGEVREVDPFITGRCFVGMVMDCALSASVWAQVAQAEFNAETVVCNNVPIFARGLCNQPPTPCERQTDGE
jgi:AcrR family transcriptional regulator